MALDLPTERPACPVCGAPGIPILYGLLSEPDLVHEHAGEVIFAGCCIPEDAPTHECSRCGTNWIDEDTDINADW